MTTELTRIGVISDTHGHLDPQVLAEFAGVQYIVHAGDIMDPATIEALEALAPVTAVAGNMDAGKLGKLPREVCLELGGIRLVVGHKRKRLEKRLALGKVDCLGAGGAPDLIIFGHDHLPAAEWVDGVLYLNPGLGQCPPRGGRRSHDRDRRERDGRARGALHSAQALRRGFLRLTGAGRHPSGLALPGACNQEVRHASRRGHHGSCHHTRRTLRQR